MSAAAMWVPIQFKEELAAVTGTERIRFTEEQRRRLAVGAVISLAKYRELLGRAEKAKRPPGKASPRTVETAVFLWAL